MLGEWFDLLLAQTSKLTVLQAWLFVSLFAPIFGHSNLTAVRLSLSIVVVILDRLLESECDPLHRFAVALICIDCGGCHQLNMLVSARR